MRAFKKVSRGFTLVELMIVVAIIGVLAALAIYGVRKYLSTAKSAEARNTIGALTRGAVAAYERENMPTQLLVAGGNGAAASHALCASATAPVPATYTGGVKYTPVVDPTKGVDYFNAGDSVTKGWACLKFQNNEPQYYQYNYAQGALGITAIPGVAVSKTGWISEAVGDLDNNKILANFAMNGDIVNGQPVTATTIAILNETE